MVLISCSSIISGFILFLFQLNLIPRYLDQFIEILLKLWPLTLILAGLLFLWNSFSRRRYLKLNPPVEKEITITYPPKSQEARLDLVYAFGNMNLESQDGSSSRLRYFQFGSLPEPMLEVKTLGNLAVVKLSKPKQLFSATGNIRSNWQLLLGKGIRHTLNLRLTEADCLLDLRALDTQELSLYAGTGRHTIFFPTLPTKFIASLYCASEDLFLNFPDNSFIKISLVNPFCAVDFPQGDFEKKEDGSILSVPSADAKGLIEITVDGPLRRLIIDLY